MAAQDGGRSELMATLKPSANITNKSIITTGFPEVDNLLATLEDKLQKKAIRKGTRAGAKVVLNRSKSLVPHGETGVLQSTLTVRVASRVVDESGKFLRKLKRGKEFGHMVTHRDTGDDDPYYSHFVEFGTVSQDEQGYIRQALWNSSEQVLSSARHALINGVLEIGLKAKK